MAETKKTTETKAVKSSETKAAPKTATKKTTTAKKATPKKPVALKTKIDPKTGTLKVGEKKTTKKAEPKKVEKKVATPKKPAAPKAPKVEKKPRTTATTKKLTSNKKSLSGLYLGINSNINLEKSIKITYDVKDNEINYAKIDNIKDGMDNYFKFKYFNLSGKTYIFILFNNYENLEDYTLIEYKNESIGYIIYSNNYLEMIVDKYKKETTFSFYDDEHKYINKIRRCNEEM